MLTPVVVDNVFGEEKISFPYGRAESLHWRNCSQPWADASLFFLF